MERRAASEKKSESRAAAWQRTSEGSAARISFAAPGNDRVVQRWTMPALDETYAKQNANKLPYLSYLPASNFQNVSMGQSGGYNVPTENEAVLGNFAAGGAAGNTPFTIDTYKARQAFYERGHIIARVLGGPGTYKNIVPIKATLNKDMFDNIESPIIESRKEDPKRFFTLNVGVTYGGHDNDNLTVPEKSMPATFTYTLTEKLYKGSGFTRNLDRWQDAGTGNLIPGNHQVKTHDLSDLDAAANNNATKYGVTRTEYELQLVRLNNACDDVDGPEIDRDEYKDEVLDGYATAINSDTFKSAFTNSAETTFKQLFKVEVDKVIRRMRLDQYERRKELLIDIVLEKYESLKLKAMELGNLALFDQGRDNILDRIDNTSIESILTDFDTVRTRVTVAADIYYFNSSRIHEQRMRDMERIDEESSSDDSDRDID